jgi:hypothetical protein
LLEQIIVSLDSKQRVKELGELSQALQIKRTMRGEEKQDEDQVRTHSRDEVQHGGRI